MVLVMLVGIALAQGPTTPLVGTVVAQDGTPVEGADLVLTGPTPGESPVVARGKSGAGGTFRFDRPAGLAVTDLYMVPTLWAAAPGHRVAVIRFARKVPAADEPVRVVLGPPARTEIRVETPDGAPLVGARVNVQRTKSEPMPVPDPVVDLIERTTGPDGIAVLDAFGPEEVGSVDVIAKGFGTQPRWFDPNKREPKIVRLRPVVPLKGQLVAAKGQPKLAAAAKGWRVRAWTRRPGDARQTDTMAGYGETTTDDEGRFALPEIAPGSLQLAVMPPGGGEGELDLLPELPLAAVVRDDRENVLEIPLRTPSTVTGLVVERGTGKPVVGMRVILFPLKTGYGVNATTDAQGRYTFKTLAGKASVSGPKAPPGYASHPALRRDGIDVPEAPGRVDLGTTEIPRAAPPLNGQVRDELGKPVAGALVRGQWSVLTPRGNSSGFTSLKTDDQGRFILEGLAPGAKVRLTAVLRDEETTAPEVVVTGVNKAITLRVLPQRLRPMPHDGPMGPERLARDRKRQAMLAAILAQQKPRPAVVRPPQQMRARIMIGGAPGANVALDMVQDQPPPAVHPPEFEADDAVEDEAAPLQPRPVKLVRNNWVIAPEAFDQFLFEGSPDAEVGRALLDAMLAAEIESAARDHGLTPAQQAKLKLAGRGDIKRLLDRAETGRREFHRIRTNLNECQILFRRLQPLRLEIKEGPFFAGSLYSKTLTKMIAEESIRGRDSRQERP